MQVRHSDGIALAKNGADRLHEANQQPRATASQHLALARSRGEHQFGERHGHFAALHHALHFAHMALLNRMPQRSQKLFVALEVVVVAFGLSLLRIGSARAFDVAGRLRLRLLLEPALAHPSKRE